MLAELAMARERESAEQARIAAMQAELARAASLTAMGEMTASIAHEINQPLAAVVNNASAGLRWLGHQPPNVERTRAILMRIINDGGRASEVIASIRAMLTKGGQARARLDINDLIREVMTLVRSELQGRGVSIRTELSDSLPHLSGNRVQLRQVILNLIMNAVEAMASIKDRAGGYHAQVDRCWLCFDHRNICTGHASCAASSAGRLDHASPSRMRPR
jgi:C4-dicarboxylate-specific signal transduction histidine kinase